MSIMIDTNIFLRLVFQEEGWERCGKLLDSVYSGRQEAIISAIQISELYTPFERAHDMETRDKISSEIKKSKIRIKKVDVEIAELSARIRATEKTPGGNFLALADSIILATALRERVETLYTLDMDYSKVKSKVNISAPEMSIEEWHRTYSAKQD